MENVKENEEINKNKKSEFESQISTLVKKAV